MVDVSVVGGADDPLMSGILSVLSSMDLDSLDTEWVEHIWEGQFTEECAPLTEQNCNRDIKNILTQVRLFCPDVGT